MTDLLSDSFAPELALALAHTPVPLRQRLQAALALDHRLAKLVSGTNEPMLGQMRLAWWRDMLSVDAAQRPEGDQVLDAIAQHWPDDARKLVDLVDAWECMLAEPPLSKSLIQDFANGRGGLFSAALGDAADLASVNSAGERWALIDAALHIANEEERALFLALARAIPASGALKSPFKGLAILNALSVRSLKNDLSPLMQGRSAALIAWRAAILGR